MKFSAKAPIVCIFCNMDESFYSIMSEEGFFFLSFFFFFLQDFVHICMGIMCFWKPFYFVLGYNQLTVLWWFQVNSRIQSVFLKMVISQSVFFKEGSSRNKLIANLGFSLLMTLTDFNSLSLHLYVCFIVGRGRGKRWRSLRWNVGCSFFMKNMVIFSFAHSCWE